VRHGKELVREPKFTKIVRILHIVVCHKDPLTFKRDGLFAKAFDDGSNEKTPWDLGLQLTYVIPPDVEVTSLTIFQEAAKFAELYNIELAQETFATIRVRFDSHTDTQARLHSMPPKLEPHMIFFFLEDDLNLKVSPQILK